MNILSGKNIVVFDCETLNEVDGKNITWKDKHKMGLSVGCLYDYKTDDFHVFFQEDIKEFADQLNEAEMLVGFNIVGFDNELVRALGGPLKPEKELNCYDLLIESRLAAGWNPKLPFPKGMKLDDHLESTFGKQHMKLEHGADAPRLWREGKHARVVSYCLSDVKREKMLFEHVFFKGWASTESQGKKTFNTERIHEIVNKGSEIDRLRSL